MSVNKGWRVKWKDRVIRITGGKLLGFGLLLVLVAFTALPLIYVVSTALKPMDELFLFPPRFFVQHPTLKNFSDLVIVLDSLTVPFTRYVFNSVLVSLSVVVLTIVVSSMAAYGLVKHRVVCGNLLFGLVLAGLMVSSYVTQIPSFMIVSSLKMVDTYWALIIPRIAVAYNMFLIKQFMEQMPDSFLEAARMDGAGEIRIFLKIVVPFLRPVIATLFVFSFVACWNDYFSPLIYTQNESLKTLPLALQNISSNLSIARAGATAAATFIMIVPTILVYTAAQRSVVDSMAFSGIKA